MNRRAILVSVPMATSQAVVGASASNALRIASIAGMCVMGGEEGGGKSFVPASPDSPNYT